MAPEPREDSAKRLARPLACDRFVTKAFFAAPVQRAQMQSAFTWEGQQCTATIPFCSLLQSRQNRNHLTPTVIPSTDGILLILYDERKG